MDLEINILSKTNTNIIWHCLYVESNLQKDTNELIYKTETHIDVEKKLMVSKCEMCWGEGINQELRINTLLYISYIINKGLLYNTRNSTQYSLIIFMGKESEKGLVYV